MSGCGLSLAMCLLRISWSISAKLPRRPCTHIAEMSVWEELAKRGKSSKEVIQVNVPATPEKAEYLKSRLKILRALVVPAFAEAEAERA